MIGLRTSKRSAVTRLISMISVATVALLLASGSSTRVSARDYQRISGEGSTWAQTAIEAMRVNVQQFGITVDYAGTGSTSGRKNFLNGTVDFAASDIPFQFTPEDGSTPDNPVPDSYAYIPVVAGGTAFMYNLIINGQRVTNLRLSGENIVKIFTRVITMWNDPALQADNPGITLPGRPVVAVVRSDGSGSTAQFTTWMIHQHGALWNDYCARSGRAPACGSTSFYPTITGDPGTIGQSGDSGVATYVTGAFAEGAIGYVNYSYALGLQFPVVKVLNAAGYYTEPTPQNVAVSLLKAKINEDASNPAVYLTQQLDDVYTDTDPRNYQLSSYSYFILPTVLRGNFNKDKGQTLGDFAYYAMCQAQQQSASLGYSPLPVNLVTASFDQIKKIPGVAAPKITVADCKNPTFSPDGTNLLADNAPQPKACDQQGPSQCADGTGGLQNVPTATAGAPAASGNGATGAGAADGSGSAAGPAAADTGSNNAGAAAAGPATGAGPSAAAGSGAPVAGGTTGSATGTPGANGNPAAVGGGATPACDADTGQGCAIVAAATPANGQAASGQAANAPAVGPVKTATLKSDGRLGAAIPLILVALFTLGLVLAPAVAWRYLSNRAPI